MSDSVDHIIAGLEDTRPYLTEDGLKDILLWLAREVKALRAEVAALKEREGSK
jgi:hypothetical protein